MNSTAFLLLFAMSSFAQELPVCDSTKKGKESPAELRGLPRCDEPIFKTYNPIEAIRLGALSTIREDLRARVLTKDGTRACMGSPNLTENSSGSLEWKRIFDGNDPACDQSFRGTVATPSAQLWNGCSEKSKTDWNGNELKATLLTQCGRGCIQPLQTETCPNGKEGQCGSKNMEAAFTLGLFHNAVEKYAIDNVRGVVSKKVLTIPEVGGKVACQKIVNDAMALYKKTQATRDLVGNYENSSLFGRGVANEQQENLGSGDRHDELQSNSTTPKQKLFYLKQLQALYVTLLGQLTACVSYEQGEFTFMKEIFGNRKERENEITDRTKDKCGRRGLNECYVKIVENFYIELSTQKFPLPLDGTAGCQELNRELDNFKSDSQNNSASLFSPLFLFIGMIRRRKNSVWKKTAAKLLCLGVFMSLNACSLLIKQPKFDAGFDCKGEAGQYPNHCCANNGKGEVIKTAPENPECPPGGIGGALIQGSYDKVAGLLKNMNEANGNIAMLEYNGTNAKGGFNLSGAEQAAATADPNSIGTGPLSVQPSPGQTASQQAGISSRGLGGGGATMNLSNPLGSSSFNSGSNNSKNPNQDSATEDANSSQNATSSAFKNGGGGSGGANNGEANSGDWINPFFNKNGEDSAGITFAGNPGVSLQKFGMGALGGSRNLAAANASGQEDADTYLRRIPSHLSLFEVVHRKYQKVDQDWTLKKIRSK